MASAQPSDFSLSYSSLIAERVLAEARPKSVASRHINRYPTTGPSGALDLSRFNDIGRADTVAAGTEYVTEAAVGSTAVTVTPSRRMKMALVDIETARQRVPGRDLDGVIGGIASSFQGMTIPQVNEFASIAADAFGAEAAQIVRSHEETVEYDTVQGLGNLSRSSGATGQNGTVDYVEDALYTLENGESLPHRRIVASCDLRYIYDLRADIRANETATPFTSDIASILALQPDLERNGLQGALLGVPHYAHDSDVRLYANGTTDVVSAYFLRGEGAPETDGSGYAGCYAFVQRHAPLLTLKWISRASSVEILLMWPWAVAERVDNWGVKMITGAT